jgi:ferrous iron transport protein B
MSKKTLTVALVGNPNSGKTTVFNALTGSKQHIGNWPGVTVERKEGYFTSNGIDVRVVDLPGVYALAATSEDERVTVDYVIGGEADLFVNIIDGTNIERNLYLTLLLSELRVPMIHVVTMMDIVEDRGTQIDMEHLGEHLGCPVIGINASNRRDVKKLLELIAKTALHSHLPVIKVAYPNEVEDEVKALLPYCEPVCEVFKANARWVALKMLEGDTDVSNKALQLGAISREKLEAAQNRIRKILNQYPDEVLANARYGVIQGLCHEIVKKGSSKEYFTQRADRLILNRWLGIPFFLLVMFMVFWITQVVGSRFIDFFEIFGETVFIDGTAHILTKLGAAPFIVAIVAHGLGAGLQTMATFIPPIFLMFFCLSLLEDSGYMARAAFVMDRFMQWLGLPGKSFVPLLVGFGCTVPAIMATRTLESKRDRFITIFMTPFMSCGAKLPVYVVFGAAFFARRPGMLVFLLYFTGMILAVVTGLLLKHTIFKGKPSHFIMELPPYHMPRMRHIMLHSIERLNGFIIRAGQVIVPMVLLLGVLNTLGKDGTIGNEDTENSVLTSIGMAITPVFEPMGIEPDNWPASVSIFTGLFAKEAVIGTLTSLYGQNRDEMGEIIEEEEETYSFINGVREAFSTLPIIGGLFSEGEEEEQDEDADSSLFRQMRNHFPAGRHQAFAYLLFILLYVPCIAAMGAAFQALGKLYGVVLMVYLTLLGWSTSTLYYQITLGHSLLWGGVASGILAAMIIVFMIMGRYRRVPI